MKMKTLEWQTSICPQAGRIAQISDEGCAYWAALSPRDTLEYAVRAFRATYDCNEFSGPISCDARLLVDGAEMATARFVIECE